jgi:transcriptional regulator with XRE-family HTH domain
MNESAITLFLGRIIAAHRIKAGVSQTDFAKAIRTHQTSISRIEKGDLSVSAEQLVSASKVLDTDARTLLTQAEEAAKYALTIASTAYPPCRDTAEWTEAKRQEIGDIAFHALATFACNTVVAGRTTTVFTYPSLPHSWLSCDGIVRVPEKFPALLGLPNGGPVAFMETDSPGCILLMSLSEFGKMLDGKGTEQTIHTERQSIESPASMSLLHTAQQIPVSRQ